MIEKQVVISSAVEKSNKIKYYQISPLRSPQKLGLTPVEMTGLNQDNRSVDA